MPSMLSRIVDDLLVREPDMVVVGRSPGGGDALREARDNLADMLITQDEFGDGGTCLDTILAAPPLNILAISRDGLTGARISLSRHPINLGAEGGATLAEAIRGLAVES
jgi:chemotaxis response regulator CheB